MDDMDAGDIEGMGDEAPLEEPADDMEVPGEEDVTAKSTANQESSHPEAEGTNVNRTVNEEELAQALETIEQLKKDLHETNLLNSKLLYVNKIFKANNLSES